MTIGDFVQKKFGLFLLTFLTVFFTSVSLLALTMGVWFPAQADIFIGLADWSTKAAVGPLVGALISSIVTPHDAQRREDSAEYTAKNDTTRTETTTTETVTTPKVVTQPAEPIVVKEILDTVKTKEEKIGGN